MTAPAPPPDRASGAPRFDEAHVATPPRGIRLTPDPAPSRHALPNLLGTVPQPVVPAPRRRARTLVAVIALVAGLLGVAWVSTDHARTTWLPGVPHEAVTADESGVAEIDGLEVSLVEVVDLGADPDLPETDWQPPAGYHAWRVVLESVSTNTDLFTCAVALVDGEGRHFQTNYFVDSFVEGYSYSYTCGVDDELGPQQTLLAIMPEGVEPETVWITEYGLNPAYIELDVP